MSHVIVVDDNRSDGYLTVQWIGRDCFSDLRFEHTFRLTDEELSNVLQGQMLIQNAAPALSADERELFITGMYPGSLGEATFCYSCPNCGHHHEWEIASIGLRRMCSNCESWSEPFKVSEVI